QKTVLKVYDLLGREIATLIDGILPAGQNSVKFDASGLASGIYLYQLKTGSSVITRKMSLLK
ncbi:MAG: T9SS type A sorting domain-containing protein, partial [Bacteroidota bacterium]|nr:T9SS type A sorting domain-containing protein [Bacteroidota bacterium]